MVVSQGTGLMPGKNLKVNIIKSFSENLLSIPQLFEMNYATVFHPTHGIIIANANEMKVTCSAPLGIGKYIDGTFLMDINVGPSTAKACATGAIATSLEAANSGVSLGIPLAISPVLELSTRCILWYKRLGFTSIQRIVDAIHHKVIMGIDLPSSVQVKDFPTQDVEAVQVAQSKLNPIATLELLRDQQDPIKCSISILNISASKVGEDLLASQPFSMITHEEFISCHFVQRNNSWKFSPSGTQKLFEVRVTVPKLYVAIMGQKSKTISSMIS